MAGFFTSLLNHLLAERERKLGVADKRIAAVNDRTILAIAQVVQQCQVIKSKTAFEEAANG